MTDANLIDACIHKITWWTCNICCNQISPLFQSQKGDKMDETLELVKHKLLAAACALVSTQMYSTVEENNDGRQDEMDLAVFNDLVLEYAELLNAHDE